MITSSVTSSLKMVQLFNALLFLYIATNIHIHCKHDTLYDTDTKNEFQILKDNREIPHESWKGKWFPKPPESMQAEPNELYDSLVEDKRSMGVVSDSCDNGMVNLTLDWNYSETNYLCFYNRYPFGPKSQFSPELSCDTIPKAYVARHECMDTPINYDDRIPTFGTHRPLWPKYGTYKYVPPQRWLHSLEHGAIVMLYHPCADPDQVKLLKSIVRGCLYRHIITPYPKLTSTYPLALVSWGCRLKIAKVDTEIVTNFIKQFALRGPEKKADDGQFNQLLNKTADTVSDLNDSALCPTTIHHM